MVCTFVNTSQAAPIPTMSRGTIAVLMLTLMIAGFVGARRLRDR